MLSVQDWCKVYWFCSCFWTFSGSHRARKHLTKPARLGKLLGLRLSVLAGQVKSTVEYEKISGATWNQFRSYVFRANKCGRSQLDSRGISWVFPVLKLPCRFVWAHSSWSQLDFFIPYGIKAICHMESSQNLPKATGQGWEGMLSHTCWTSTVTCIWGMDNPQPNSIIMDENTSKQFKKS